MQSQAPKPSAFLKSPGRPLLPQIPRARGADARSASLKSPGGPASADYYAPPRLAPPGSRLPARAPRLPYAPVAQNPENTQVIAVPADASASKSSDSGNSSLEGFQWLDTWNHMKQLANISNGLPHANEAIKDARVAWENLTISVQNTSSPQSKKERLCPYSIRRMDASKLESGAVTIDVPCGLIVGSSVTIIGTPGSLSGNFWIDLLGTALPGESELPIVLRYNVRLTGDKLTEGPVIVQNAFTASNGWGYEDRCPCSNSNNATEVDDLERCNSMVGREEKSIMKSKSHLSAKKGGQPSTYFPFKQGYLVITTLRIGLEGIHMTVDGKHITSFAYRAGLEPWFVTEVRISGDFKLLSSIASGLPTSEGLENSFDLEMLKSPPIPVGKDVNLLIGIFSTANNFKRRMVIRRTWMQYDAVRKGAVAVRFFVGLVVNKELWNEAHTYGDIQLLPFVDYYSLITWKTLAICIYGTSAVSAKYLMKTDDDAFVRVDEIHSSVKQLNVSHGLLYGRINSDSGPHRNPESKWYISPEVMSPQERVRHHQSPYPLLPCLSYRDPTAPPSKCQTSLNSNSSSLSPILPPRLGDEM